MNKRRRSFFARLRRDGLLFALVATAIVALHALQPVATAWAKGSGLHEVLCQPSVPDMPMGSGSTDSDDCDACVGGPCGGFARILPADPIDEPAFFAEQPDYRLSPSQHRVATRRIGDPPPAPRAPPLSA